MSSAHALTPHELRIKTIAANDDRRHDAMPDAALAAIVTHDGPILIDLDETLYLRNSTEDFIDSAKPALLALILLRVLDVIKPWRWSGGDVTRDVWRVSLVRIIFPWSMSRWRKRIAILANRFANAPLLRAAKTRPEHIYIATVGFKPIVTPLIVAMGIPPTHIIAARLKFQDRIRGKLALAMDRLGRDQVCRSLVVTDSLDDMTLLDNCTQPLRVIWPGAHYRRALAHVYLPGQYLTQVKRPGERYIIRGILQEDFAFWILSSIALATAPLTHLIGLTFLLASFWTIYERGYVSNDLAAARYEAQPKLSAAFKQAPVATPRWQPWIWSGMLGVIAIFALRWPTMPRAVDYCVWGAVLLATYGWFDLYNRFDKATRVWLFGGLQLARVAAFAALVPILPVGAAALGAHTLTKWIPYYVYRLGNKAWPEMPLHLIRLIFFAVLCVFLVAVHGIGALLNWSALALLAWNIYRARTEIAVAYSAAKRLDRAPTPVR